MEAQEKLELGIGTKEAVALKPTKVKIVKVDVKPQRTKEGKDIGEKIVCSCKHPDRDELINISTVKYERNNKLKISGLWLTLDEDGLIRKGSALAIFLSFVGAKNVKFLEQTEISTAEDESGYLTFRAY